MKASFEEKTYESYFNSELGQLSDVYFPIGQVQEGFLGFDSSALSKNRKLWKRIGYPFFFHLPFRGVEIQDLANEMEHIYGYILNELPKIKANIIIQYKRPAYITSRAANEWQYWKKPYYRYDVYKEQQKLLDTINNKFRNDVLTIYAAPAMHKIDELVAAYKTKNIINYSNICDAKRLSKHDHNSYIKAGTNSYACSDPEVIEDLNLLQELESIVNENNNDNLEYIINFSESVERIILESKHLKKSYLILKEMRYDFEKYEILKCLNVMDNVNQITGLQWALKI